MTENLEVDVAIIGGGFTGLWTAYQLITTEPKLKISILEKEEIGFGASGRNGGWASALYPVSHERIEKENGKAAADLVRKYWRESIAKLENFAKQEGVDIGFHLGGSLMVARNSAQLKRINAKFSEFESEGYVKLSKDESDSRIRVQGSLGALYTPYCARIHPLKLVHAIANAVEKRGVEILEKTYVTNFSPGLVETAVGNVKAKIIVLATEGYLSQFANYKRSTVPLYSLMVATEPLPQEFWQEIGWDNNETFSQASHLINYAQRTSDNRLAIGGRGAPYHFRSMIKTKYDNHKKTQEGLRNLSRDWFPSLSKFSFTHAWGGPLGIARDWHPTVTFNKKSGVAHAGGFVGDGVVSSYIAGECLRDLILNRESELLALPWINHVSPKWEPEPIRWLALHAGLGTAKMADHEEKLTARPSVIAKIIAPLVGS